MPPIPQPCSLSDLRLIYPSFSSSHFFFLGAFFFLSNTVPGAGTGIRRCLLIRCCSFLDSLRNSFAAAFLILLIYLPSQPCKVFRLVCVRNTQRIHCLLYSQLKVFHQVLDAFDAGLVHAFLFAPRFNTV